MADRDHVAVVRAHVPLLVAVAVEQVVVRTVLVLIQISVVGARPVVVDAGEFFAHGALVVPLEVPNLVLRRPQVVKDVLHVHVWAHLVGIRGGWTHVRLVSVPKLLAFGPRVDEV